MSNQDGPQPVSPAQPGASGQPPAAGQPQSPGQPSAAGQPPAAGQRRPGTPGQPASLQPAPAQPTSGTGATGATGSDATPSSPPPAPPSSLPAAAGPGSRLAARINPVGALPPGSTGIVGFSVTNSGPAPALQVTANVSLPVGVSLMVGGTLGLDSTVHASPGGWTCVPVASGARCTHGPLAAAASTTSYLQVAVAPGAPAGPPPAISVDSGHDRVTARGTSGVPAGGFPAWFAAVCGPVSGAVSTHCIQ
jgi:hypothetical protein